MKYITTKAKLSQELGCARSTLHRWEQLDNFPKKTARGWNLEACMKFVAAQGLNSPPILAEEKRRLLSAQADRAELLLAKERGELVSVESVKETTARLIGQWLDIMKRCLSKTDFNAINRQFQNARFEELL